MPAITGLITQLINILKSEDKSVGVPVNKFQPIIAPITACEVETGSLAFVIQVIEIPTARATVKLPAIAFIPPRLFNVSVDRKSVV